MIFERVVVGVSPRFHRMWTPRTRVARGYESHPPIPLATSLPSARPLVSALTTWPAH
jgi:hypothetical protein